MSICQDRDFIKMARRSTVTWRSRVLVRAKSPFVDDFRVGNNKRKRDIEDKKKPKMPTEDTMTALSKLLM